jgi:peptidyl-prolyl cis-trans isomerase C
MTVTFGSKVFGTLLVVSALGAALTTNVLAESIATINGTDIDSTVFDAYLESRLQKPAAEATADERTTILKEITDIYLITTQPRARELAEEPHIKAQLELQYRGTLVQTAAKDFVTNNQATDEEILAQYTAQNEGQQQLEFKARHILVESQGLATQLIGRLDSGADFEELAKENSTGPSGPNGGDLGWFTSERMVKPFVDAVAALADGAYTKTPVQTQFGWHVILREESRPSVPPTLESVREGIKQRIEQQKFQSYVQGLRDEYASSN